MYWDIKNLSEYLNIKPSTLYAWVAKGKVPFIKLHGLIRFHPDEIHAWLEALRPEKTPSESYLGPNSGHSEDIDALIERAKRKAYNGPYGRPDQDRARKERKNGAV